MRFVQLFEEHAPEVDSPLLDYIGAYVEEYSNDHQLLAESIYPFLSAYPRFSEVSSVLSLCQEIFTLIENELKANTPVDFAGDSDHSEPEVDFLHNTPAPVELSTVGDFFADNLEKLKVRKSKNQSALNSSSISLGGASLLVSFPSNGVKSSSDGSFLIDSFSLSYGSKELLHDTSLSVAPGYIYGLVGRNGVGKSSLFSAIASGKFNLHSELAVFLVRQDCDVDAIPAVLAVLDAHRDEQLRKALIEYYTLKEIHKVTDTDPKANRLASLEIYLTEQDALGEIEEVKKILRGLGFGKDPRAPSINTLATELSGGFRMRLSLAAALFSKYPIILLDEPTSHLDIASLVWLERCLRRSIDPNLSVTEARKPKFEASTILLVSHDVSFLDNVCTHIIHLDSEAKKLRSYKGNYTAFVELRNQQMTNQKKLYEAQQAKIAHMNAFVNRWRASAARASAAQSRIKALAKMTIVDPVQSEIDLTFSFPSSAAASDAGHLIELKNVYFKYAPELPFVLENVEFHIPQGARIGIIGSNGGGKSTLVKLITGMLSPTSGTITTKITPENTAIYHQHFADSLMLEDTPLDFIAKLHPSIDALTIRQHLGSWGIVGDCVFRPNKTFSGGEKARIVMAAITLARTPRLLLLDELSNYLCSYSINALIESLADYDGSVVCISHNRYFIEHVCEELWMVNGNKVEKYPGSINDYCKTL
ncbi:hypothetical protein RCL1_003337 [Eukaryota sp. TZLM3-RCL]